MRTPARVIECTPKTCKLAGTVPAGKILVDGTGVGDVGSVVLRDRKHLAQDGMIVVCVNLSSEDGSVLSGPDIISRGFVYMKDDEDLMDAMKMIATHSLEVCHNRNISDWATIKSTIKGDLSQFLYQEHEAQPHDPAGHYGNLKHWHAAARQRAVFYADMWEMDNGKWKVPAALILSFPSPVKPQFFRSGKFGTSLIFENFQKFMSCQETSKPAAAPFISNFSAENPRRGVDISPVPARVSGCAGCECGQSIHAIMHRSSGVFHMGLCRSSC